MRCYYSTYSILVRSIISSEEGINHPRRPASYDYLFIYLFMAVRWCLWWSERDLKEDHPPGVQPWYGMPTMLALPACRPLWWNRGIHSSRTFCLVKIGPDFGYFPAEPSKSVLIIVLHSRNLVSVQLVVLHQWPTPSRIDFKSLLMVTDRLIPWRLHYWWTKWTNKLTLVCVLSPYIIQAVQGEITNLPTDSTCRTHVDPTAQVLYSLNYGLGETRRGVLYCTRMYTFYEPPSFLLFRMKTVKVH